MLPVITDFASQLQLHNGLVQGAASVSLAGSRLGEDPRKRPQISYHSYMSTTLASVSAGAIQVEADGD